MARHRLNFPWRPPESEPGPITLTSRRLYILPTRAGIIFAALIPGLLVASSNYSVSLGYLFSFLLVGIAMAGLLHTHRNLLGIRLLPTSVTPVYAGESAEFKLHIENPDNRPRGALLLSLGGRSGTEADLVAHGQTDFDIHLAQPKRGLYRPGTLTLSSTWPLGLFRCWTVFAFDWSVLVYPKPAPSPLPFPDSNSLGDGKTAERPGDEEFLTLRNYHPGDAPSRMAWKTMARGLPPLTKQFSEIRSDAITLDWEAAPERETEAKLSRLVRWVLDAEASGRPWSLRLPGHSLLPGRGPAHLKRALESLARYGET